jgi:hypothetical protein
MLSTKLPPNDLYIGDRMVANASGELADSAYYKTYYVDVNAGTAGNNALSWAKPEKTLAAAIILSNAAIAAGAYGWAARNRIFYKGDNNEAAAETLITLPSKCDVIGVGSYDHRDTPMMIGNHVVGAGAYMGCRFINMGFLSPAAGGAIFTVPTTTSGLCFMNCVFDGRSSTAATIGLSLTAVEQAKIIGCRFFGKFSTEAIYIGTGASRALLIDGNYIESGAIGIAVHASATCADAIGIISNNIIYATTLVIDENSDKMMIVNNRCVTLAADTLALIIDYNSALACGNIITDATVTANYPTIGTTAS